MQSKCMKKKIESVQKLLKEQNLDGWLLYDFRKQNDLACSFLEIPAHQMITRRFFYFIPAKGEPQLLTHAVEKVSLPGKHQSFTTWQDLSKRLNEMLKSDMTIAMETSSNPYLSRVDGYTLDLVRTFVKEVVSSGDLLQRFTSVLNTEQIETHLRAANALERIAEATWNYIADGLGKVTEWDVSQYIQEQMRVHDCVTDDAPICAVNAHSADPHYMVEEGKSSTIKAGDFILIDLWTRENSLESCYADITQVGVAGEPSAEHKKIFAVVKNARDVAIAFVQNGFQKGEKIRGCDVDRVARDVIAKEGYGEYFIHRLGHNIFTKDHGPGAHLDSYETNDTRVLLAGTCFSIEPGIYLPGKFGVRLECDILVHPNGNVEVTGGLQDQLPNILH